MSLIAESSIGQLYINVVLKLALFAQHFILDISLGHIYRFNSLFKTVHSNISIIFKPFPFLGN